MNKMLSTLVIIIMSVSAPIFAADVPYISGGISEEGRTELNQSSQNYNLKLIFALSSGAYLSDIKVQIQDAGGARVVEAVSTGPWFFAQLPPGKYALTVSNNDQTLRKSARVKRSGQTKINFYWRDE